VSSQRRRREGQRARGRPGATRRRRRSRPAVVGDVVAGVASGLSSSHGSARRNEDEIAELPSTARGEGGTVVRRAAAASSVALGRLLEKGQRGGRERSE